MQINNKIQNVITIELSNISGGCTCYNHGKSTSHPNVPTEAMCINICCKGNGLPKDLDTKERLGYSFDDGLSYTMPGIISCDALKIKIPGIFPEEKGGRRPGFLPKYL